MEYKISIIVPIFNVENYVIKCIDSLINQTYGDVIIYAVSDGSTDDSVKKIREMNYPNDSLIIVEKENGGYGSVIEYAISNIETEYFMICDPDDYLDIDAVTKMFGMVLDNDLDIIVGDKFLIHEDCDEVEIRTYLQKPYYIEAKKIYHYEDVGKFAFLDVSPHAKIIRKSLVENISFPRKVAYTDFLLYIMALNKAKKIMYVNEPYAYYLIDRLGNSSTANSLKAVKEHMIVWNETVDNLEKCSTQNDYLLYRIFIEYVMIKKMIKQLSYADKSEIKLQEFQMDKKTQSMIKYILEAPKPLIEQAKVVIKYIQYAFIKNR